MTLPYDPTPTKLNLRMIDGPSEQLDADEDLNTTIRLVKRAQTGEPPAVESLLTRYLPWVRQIVALRTGRKLRQFYDLEDIVQQVLMRVLRDLKGYEPQSVGSFRNWLAKRVEREIVEHARWMGRAKRGGGKVRRFADCDSSLLASSIFADAGPTPSALAQAGELAETIEEALLNMSEHNRELILLRAVCGMSYDDVAAELGVAKAATVRVAFFRAIRELKEASGL